MEIRNTHPGKERQIQDGPRVIISPEQNHSYDPEHDICEELEPDEEERTAKDGELEALE